jgi:hypothetical protein
MRKIKLTSISKNPQNRLTKVSMRSNLLDFTASGQAVIDMPNYSEISFLENFGFSPIESVEQEIKDADSPERAAFLQHYVDVFKKTFTELPKSYIDEDEDEEPFDFHLTSESSIRFSNVRLLHTTAWYMMGRIDAEINAVKRHLEEIDCLGIVVENLEEFIHLIRISKDTKEACARFQKRLEIGYVKAQYLLNLPLAKVTSFDAVKLAIEKVDFQKRLTFLEQLNQPK